MIAHIILFQPRPDLNDEQRAEVIRAFTTATAGAPTVRSVRVGRRVRHGRAGYEQTMRQHFEYAAIVEFDNLAGLEAYLEHPAHLDAGRHFTQSAEAALAYDYALVPAAETAALAAKKE